MLSLERDEWSIVKCPGQTPKECTRCPFPHPRCFWNWSQPGREISQIIRRCHPCARKENALNAPKAAPQAILGRAQATLQATRRTPHGASCLVRAMSVWSAKTRHGTVGMRVSLALRTTATHDTITPPPPLETPDVLRPGISGDPRVYHPKDYGHA